MKTSITLSIPKPCSEKWENFTPTSSGGFCGSCNKVVTDFTKMSDTEILNFLKNKPVHACGRLRPDQITTYSETATLKINPGVALFRAGLLSLFIALISKPTSAQVTPKKTTTEAIAPKQHQEASVEDRKFEHMFTGTVRSSEDGEVLPGVNVVLKGSVWGTATDEKGSFKFPQPLKEGDVLIFTFIGLQSKEYTIQKITDTRLAITMNLDIQMACDYTTLGELVVNEVYTEPSGFRKIWSRVKGLF